MGWVTRGRIETSGGASPTGASPTGVSPTGVSLSKSRLVVICLLLLMASAINYMDRQTLSAASIRISEEFGLSDEQYGRVEGSFGIGFAVGSIVFGVLVDWLSVRWLYPLALLAWSGVGFWTGRAEGYADLVFYRGWLGFFEAAHWPCALVTTVRILGPAGRSFGNSVLQSGTSVGAIVTPLLMLWFMNQPGWGWRYGFQVVGVMGLVWIVAWVVVVRGESLRGGEASSGGERGGWLQRWVEFGRDLLTMRMVVVLWVVVMINSSWQILRAWMPKIMDSHGYTESVALRFSSLWYLVTDLGCLGSGYLVYRMARGRWGLDVGRKVVFGMGVGMSMALWVVPQLSPGGWLLLMFLMAGAGVLGLFPIFYALSQEVSPRNVGKVTGVASFVAWMASAPIQAWFGRLKDQTDSFNQGLAVLVLMLIAAWLGLVFLWPRGAVDQERS